MTLPRDEQNVVKPPDARRLIPVVAGSTELQSCTCKDVLLVLSECCVLRNHTTGKCCFGTLQALVFHRSPCTMSRRKHGGSTDLTGLAEGSFQAVTGAYRKDNKLADRQPF